MPEPRDKTPDRPADRTDVPASQSAASPPRPAPAPTVVTAPLAAPAVAPTPTVAAPPAPPEPDPNSPYTGPSEIVPGGRYMQGTKFVRGKHYGGRIVNANGDVLAEFKDNQENTGNPSHGTKPDQKG